MDYKGIAPLNDPSARRWSVCSAQTWVLAAIGVSCLVVVGWTWKGDAVSTDAPQRLRKEPVCASRLFQGVAERDERDSSKHDALEFIAVGDWGLDTAVAHEDGPRDDWDVQSAVQLGKQVGERKKQSFVLNCGDNFYQYGIKSADDQRWDTTFNALFKPVEGLLWYSMLGNHDYKGNLEPISSPEEGVLAQIQRTFHPKNDRWCMPNFNYTIHIQRPAFELYIVVFDSQSLVRMDPDESTGAYSGPHIPNPAEQLRWLEDELCGIQRKRLHSEKPIWLFSAAHHFVISAGKYFDRRGMFTVMTEKVQPILLKCGVHVHFHGHDHVTQLISVASHNGGEERFLQVGVGSEGKQNGFVNVTQKDIDRVFPSGQYTLHFASKEAGFANVKLLPEEVEITLVDKSGATLDQIIVAPASEGNTGIQILNSAP